MSNSKWNKFKSGEGLNFELATTQWDSVRLDPYLVWACATKFKYLARKNEQNWIPIVIELDPNGDYGTADLFSIACLKYSYIQIPNIYHIDAEPYDGITFLTALVKLDEFFSALNNESPIRSSISRFQMGLSVTTGLENDQGNPSFNFGDGAKTVILESVKIKNRPIVGVIDDGVGFLNTSFNDSNGRTRIRYFWNQNENIKTPQSIAQKSKQYSVENLEYGYELKHTDIDGIRRGFAGKNLASAERSSYNSIGYRSVAGHASHGTHMLDLAAGSGNDSDMHAWNDIALIAVQVQKCSDITPDTSGRWMCVRVLDGIRYILERASRLPVSISSGLPDQSEFDDGADTNSVFYRPISINISQGNIAGPHNGTSILEKAIDQLIKKHESTRYPLKVYLSAGNHKQARCHAVVNVRPNEREILSWRVYPDDRTPNFLELWLPVPNEDCAFDESRLEIRVCAPGETYDDVQPIKLGECWSLQNNTEGPECVVVGLSKNNNAAGDRGMFLCALSPTIKNMANAATPGVWNIHLSNKSDAACEINTWIERDDATVSTIIPGKQSHFEDSNFNHLDEFGYPLQQDPLSNGVIRVEGTTNGIATGECTEIVAAKSMDDNQFAFYSGTGTEEPKLTSSSCKLNVRMPNLVACVDDARVNPGTLASGTLSGSQIGMTGTSVASALATRQQVKTELGILEFGKIELVDLPERRGNAKLRYKQK